MARALPDLDHVAGDLARLDVWRELGEQALFVALPRPGDVSRMPRGVDRGHRAAADAGECVFVAGLGGVLVPTLSEFGPEGDVGVRADWTSTRRIRCRGTAWRCSTCARSSATS